MQRSTTCIPDVELRSFIAGELPEQRFVEVETHLSSCEACRASLEATVGDQDWWNDLEEALGSTVSQVGDNENALESSVDQRTLLLELLGPTDDPAMLGRIGGYEIVALLGQGGMGAVFKAFDRSLNRFVAIKLLLPHLASSGAARKRFSREAQAAAAVVDDHVMAIHGVSEWQSVPYFVMPYSRGMSLQKRLGEEGPLELKEILRIGMQAARGLAAAHAQGLVHRDVKPANIFLDEGVERVQLMDFGLARAVDDASLTRSGTLAGTPQYMSPEQARAEAVDHRSDLFSLGSVLYAMCTGHAPFRAESSYSVLRLITDKEPRPIREVNPDIPEWLCVVISKLMAKSADDRFESATQVAELLEDCLAHVQQPTSSPLPKLVKTSAEHPEHGRVTFSGNTGWRLGKYIATVTFAFTLLFAGILIVLEFNKGTLTIDCAADDIPIRIKQGEEVVQRLTVSRQGTTRRIAAGNYVIELDSDIPKMSVEHGVVTLARGDTAVVTIKVDETDEMGHMASFDLAHTYDEDHDHSHNQLTQSVPNNAKLLVIGEDSQPVAVDAIVRAEFYSNRDDHWSQFPDRDKTISLAGLPSGKSLLVTQPQHDVISLVSPSSEAITIGRVKPEQPDRFKDVAISVDVQKIHLPSPTEPNYWIRLKFDNTSGQTFSVTERDFTLTTILNWPEKFQQFEILSPHWRRVASQMPGPIEIPHGASATLILNWNDWVAGGLWITGGAVREAGTWPPEDEPGKVWVRINAPGFATKPLSVPHPDSLEQFPDVYRAVKESDGDDIVGEIDTTHEEEYVLGTGKVVAVVPQELKQLLQNGDELLGIDPEKTIRAVELRIAGEDAPFVAQGDQVQLRFEGWPAAEPTSSFRGEVLTIDATADGEGRFRVLVLADSHDSWPEQLNQRGGVRASGWILTGAHSDTKSERPIANSSKAMTTQRQVSLSLQFLECPWREVLQYVADELSLKLTIEAEPQGTTTISKLRINDDAAIRALNRSLWEQSLVLRRTATELKLTPRTAGDKLYTSSSLFPSFVVVPDKSGNPRPSVTIAARDAVVNDPPKWLRDVPFPKLTSAFTRIEYDKSERGSDWRVGYPEADRSIAEYLAFHMGFAYEQQNTTMRLTDARLPEQPFIYIANSLSMSLSEQEVVALRDYLLGGGFLILDHSWGEDDLAALRQVMKRVLPTHDPKPLPMSHPIFHGVYDLQFKPQVPNYTDFGFAMRDVSVSSALSGELPTMPDIKLEPAEYYGYFDHERLMVFVGHNNDFMSGWRHSNPRASIGRTHGQYSSVDEYSRVFGKSQAFPMALNIAYYALTHRTSALRTGSQDSSKSVLRDLFDQYVNTNGKIPTDVLQSAIDQVATHGASDLRFRDVVLYELEKQCGSDGDRVIRRNLLRLVTKWLMQAGESAWQSEFAKSNGVVLAAQTGSLRENCELALRDLFFGQDNDGQTEKTIDWDNYWAQIRNDFVPQPIRLASE